MIKLIVFILLFPIVTLAANFTAFPDDGFTYSTQSACEAKNGKCFELKAGIEKDTMKLVKVDYQECETNEVGEQVNCVTKQRDELALDDVKKAAKDAAQAAEDAKEQNRKDAAARLKAHKAKFDNPALLSNTDIKAILKDLFAILKVE